MGEKEVYIMDPEHYNQKMWEHFDGQITSNTLTISLYVRKDDFGLSSPRLQINIGNRKTRSNTNFSMDFQKVHQYVKKYKKVMEKKSEVIKALADSPDANVSFVVQDYRRMTTTILNKNEYGGCCVKISISEQVTSKVDTVSVYVSYCDYCSLIHLLATYQNTYFQTVNSVHLYGMVRELNNSISSLNGKMSDLSFKIPDRTFTASSPSIPEEEISIDIGISEPGATEEVDEITPQPEAKEVVIEEELRNDLSEYLGKERDSVDLDIDDLTVSKQKKESVLNSDLIEKCLKNDVLNLEMYLFNCINDPNPFQKLTNWFKENSNEYLKNISEEETNSIQYMVSLYLKNYLNLHLNEKKGLPSSVPPIIFSNADCGQSELSFMYDLFLLLIYYNQIKIQIKEKENNTVENKELICFILKTLTTPLIFSFMKNISKEILTSEMVRRFNVYKEKDVFTNLQEKIYEKYKIKPDVADAIIQQESSRIYDNVTLKLDELTIEKMFPKFKKNGLTQLDHNVFKKNKFTEEQMLKLIVLDLNFKKNGKVDIKEIETTFDIKSFDDLPENVISFYNIGNKKFNNENLVRFVKQTFEKDPNLEKYLEICNLINSSYFDLKGKEVNLTLLPDEILKAIFLWDAEADSKITINYNYYIEKIQQSSLDKSMLLSMLQDLSERKETDFLKSLQISAL